MVSAVDAVFFFSSRRRHTRWTGDWSSDVCSSDLSRFSREVAIGSLDAFWPTRPIALRTRSGLRATSIPATTATPESGRDSVERSEERRVGKEGRCRWSPDHLKKQQNYKAGGCRV